MNKRHTGCTLDRLQRDFTALSANKYTCLASNTRGRLKLSLPAYHNAHRSEAVACLQPGESSSSIELRSSAMAGWCGAGSQSSAVKLALTGRAQLQ